ncbi:unnamed protein product [Lepeophtheirus salmonis]|uniref:(salmon louse) hypothetical protein n=1 Tax=Lepeophtheirus salmonis TaxID=72036 RepID=A0A7R8CLA3_LEPSM|nr:unnamed protein product [Lepeophtheirus salmonis]CAF2851263.1 unnamed protein product [Lepeophtheirus salmonis]
MDIKKTRSSSVHHHLKIVQSSIKMFFKLASTLCLAFAVAQGAPSAPSSYGAPPPAPPPSYGEPPPPPPPQPAYGAPTAPQPTYVKLADGKIMTVSYTVEGDSGFVADIVTELPEASTGDGAGSGYGAPAPLAQYLPSYAK